MKEWDVIIMDYLKPFQEINKEDIDSLCNSGLCCRRFKIINNKLYCSREYEMRVESMIVLLNDTLKKYTIRDCEFVLFYDDSINEKNIHAIMKDNKILPMIVCTSVLDKYNCILCPDFTFTYFPQYKIIDHELLCNELVDSIYCDKIPQLIYKGSMDPVKRCERIQYMKKNHIYNCEHYDIEGNNHTTFLSRKERNNYKYYLHLNGREGNAYSSALKYGLCNQVVFYSGHSIYREFWQHPNLFKEGEHYIYTKNPEELDKRLHYYIEHEEEAEKIASNAHTFFKKYLWKNDTIQYYMQKLLNEYSKRMTYSPT